MKSLGKFPDPFIEEISGQRDALAARQRLAWRLAILAGREAGRYRHAAKVTLHE